MMAMSDIPGYIMGHRFSDDPADYDAVNKRWYDKAGYGARGAHCAVTVGDPAANFANVATANNRRGVLLDNTWHAAMRCPIPWMGSLILVCKPQNNSGTTTRSRWVLLFGNQVTPTSNGYLNSQFASNARRLVMASAASAFISDLSRNDDNCRLVAFSSDQSTRLAYRSVDAVAVSTATATASATAGNALALQAANQGVRVGNLSGVEGDASAITDWNLFLFEAHWFRHNILVAPYLSTVATEMAALRAFYNAS